MQTKIDDILFSSIRQNGLNSSHNYAYTLLHWAHSGERSKWENENLWSEALMVLIKQPMTSLSEEFNLKKDKSRRISDIKDYRLLGISISGIKVFPFAPENQKSFSGFGTKFYRKGNYKSSTEPLSAIFYGANGTGKSSLYTALELAAIGYSYLSDLHGNKTVDLQKEMNRHKGYSDYPSQTIPTIKLFTKDGTHSFDYSKYSSTMHVPPAFFCGDYDYSKLIISSKIELGYLCQQIGIEPLYKLKKFLDHFYDAIVEINDILEPPKTIISFKNSKEKATQRTIKINRFRRRFHIAPSQLSRKDFRTGDLNEIMDLRERCMNTINEAIEESAVIANDLIKALIKEYQGVENDDIEITLEKNTEGNDAGYYRLVPVITVGNLTTTPKDYYNTFRYNLFFTGLKIALACTAQRVHRINFPIIFDDTFNGTDFENRNMIYKFVSSIVNNYRRLEESNKFPLQLILFTQDKLIAEGFNARLNHTEETLYNRLHHPSECVENDIDEIRLENESPLKIKLIATPC